MRLSDIIKKLAIRNFDGKYVDMEVIGASWRQSKNGNYYLVLWTKEQKTGKEFDSPVFIFSEDVIAEIVEKIGADKYPGQNDPDVSENDIVGLEFNAKISIIYSKSDDSNNQKGYANATNVKLACCQVVPAVAINKAVANFNATNQNIGSGEVSANTVFPEEEVSSSVVHTENEMDTAYNQFQNPMQNPTPAPMQNPVQNSNQNSVYDPFEGYKQTTTDFNEFPDESNKDNGGIENDQQFSKNKQESYC